MMGIWGADLADGFEIWPLFSRSFADWQLQELEHQPQFAFLLSYLFVAITANI